MMLYLCLSLRGVVMQGERERERACGPGRMYVSVYVVVVVGGGLKEVM